MADTYFRKKFRVFSDWTSELAGSPVAFGLSVLTFLVWLALGPFFKWSDAHRTWMDMLLSLTPFWMVFILQATQNRDSEIIEAKLDELLKAIDKAKIWSAFSAGRMKKSKPSRGLVQRAATMRSAEGRRSFLVAAIRYEETVI